MNRRRGILAGEKSEICREGTQLIVVEKPLKTKKRDTQYTSPATYRTYFHVEASENLK